MTGVRGRASSTVTPPTGLPVVPDVPLWCALEVAVESVGLAREHTKGVLGRDLLAADALQVVSELVTNSVEHYDEDHTPQPGAKPIMLGIQVKACWVLIAVRDPWRGMPIERDAADDAESGRGLTIVDGLVAERWTHVHRQGHKTVYALLLREGCELAPGELRRLRHS